MRLHSKVLSALQNYRLEVDDLQIKKMKLTV